VAGGKKNVWATPVDDRQGVSRAARKPRCSIEKKPREKAKEKGSRMGGGRGKRVKKKKGTNRNPKRHLCAKQSKQKAKTEGIKEYTEKREEGPKNLLSLNPEKGVATRK